MADDVASWVPESCTLPTAEQPLRVAEFDALFATSAVGAVRTAPTRLRVHLKGPEDLFDRVRDLADRESACCSFFTFAVTATGDGTVTLDVEVDPAHIQVLDNVATAAGQTG
jgi:hypothetical protein